MQGCLLDKLRHIQHNQQDNVNHFISMRVGLKHLHEVISKVGKALSHHDRLRLIEVLAQGSRSVELLSSASEIPLKSVSHHLQLLKNAGLVISRRHGRRIIYSLSGDPVYQLLRQMQLIAGENLPEVQAARFRLQSTRSTSGSISREILLSRLEKESLQLLDARPLEEFEQGHIPGAISCPAERLDELLDQLSTHSEVVVYGRSEFCRLPDSVVDLLKRNGLRGRRLEEGFVDWRLAGNPISTSS